MHFLSAVPVVVLVSDVGHSVLADRPLSKRVLGLSALVLSNTSTSESSTQAFDSSQTTESVIKSSNPLHSLVGIPNPLPSPFQAGSTPDLQNYQDIQLGECAIEDNYCSFDGSNNTRNLSILTKVFDDQCLLWNSSCSGNRTFAIDEFFNDTRGLLETNFCFSQFDQGVPPGDQSLVDIPYIPAGGHMVEDSNIIPSDCEKYNPPERLSEWQGIKSWLRSPGCALAQNEWTKMGRTWTVEKPPCCGDCFIGAENVDLYYWPEPDVNTSCLSIIGTTVNPFGYGATTGSIHDLVEDYQTGTYWACPAKNPATSTLTTDFGSTVTSVYSIITTAEITTIGSLAVKVSLFNPWSSSPCVETGTIPRDSNRSNSSAELQAKHTIEARGQTLIIPSSITQTNGLPVSTMVLGNFTLLVLLMIESDVR